MRCGTSFYNGTLGKQLTLRFWPLAALYTLVLAILFPLRGLTVQVMSHAAEAEYYAVSEVNMVFHILAPWGALLVGGIAAMVVCSHLYSTRSANFTAALAPKRTALFFTHYLTGLLWLVVPFLVMSMADLAIYLTKVPNSTQLVWQSFGIGMAVGTVALVLFYSFGVLCGMLTGHLLALPVFYVTFNVLVAGVWYLLTLLFKQFYYGYPGNIAEAPAWVLWLSPALRISQGMLQFPERLDVAPFVVYGVVGIAMALGAWLLYAKRPMERAGDVVVWAGLRPVFRYGVALCAGLALGSLTRLVLNLGQLGLAFAVLLWGVVGCFVAQMFLTKSVRVLRYWKGAGAVALTFAAMFAVMTFDLTGYENRVPATDEVASVTISGLNSYPVDTATNFHNIETRDPQAISLITQLHQQLVNQRNTLDEYHDDSTRWDVTYTLSNGTRFTRSYTIYPNRADLAQAGTVTQLANQLINDKKLMIQSYEFDQLEAEGYRLTSGSFYPLSASEGLDLSASEAQTVYQAIVKDIQEGNLSRSLFHAYDENNAHIQLHWTTTSSSYNELDATNATESMRSEFISVSITDKAVHTLDALKQLGL